MKFTEEKLERAFTELLGQEGFPHHLGITITRKPDEVLIEEDLQNFLLTQYAGQGITVNETKSIILQLKSLSASSGSRFAKKYHMIYSSKGWFA